MSLLNNAKTFEGKHKAAFYCFSDSHLPPAQTIWCNSSHFYPPHRGAAITRDHHGPVSATKWAGSWNPHQKQPLDWRRVGISACFLSPPFHFLLSESVKSKKGSLKSCAPSRAEHNGRCPLSPAAWLRQPQRRCSKSYDPEAHRCH